MRNIHPAAWVGLLFNLALGWLVFASVTSMDISTLPAAERATAEDFIQAVLAIRPFFFGLLVLQAFSLALIASGRGFGLIPAALAAFFIMPTSLIYLIGCALSYNRVKYADFRPAPPGAARSGAFFICRSPYLTASRVPAAIFAVAALVSFMLLHALDYTLICSGLAAACVYCVSRASKNPALSLHEEYFVFSPAFFATPLLVKYDEVEEARLEDRNTIIFRLRSDAGTRELRWNLRNLDKRDRREAVTELGAALETHKVPLR
jgi:hypothetical protein